MNVTIGAPGRNDAQAHVARAHSSDISGLVRVLNCNFLPLLRSTANVPNRPAGSRPSVRSPVYEQE